VAVIILGEGENPRQSRWRANHVASLFPIGRTYSVWSYHGARKVEEGKKLNGICKRGVLAFDGLMNGRMQSFEKVGLIK